MFFSRQLEAGGVAVGTTQNGPGMPLARCSYALVPFYVDIWVLKMKDKKSLFLGS